MAITTSTFKRAITLVAARLEQDHQMLTELDGRVGDGDLGLTLIKAFRALEALPAPLPDDLGQALFQIGSAISKASSSSFGTLMATGLLAVAKGLKGVDSVAWADTAALVTTAREAMQNRGKASLGDKTVLDALKAIEEAIAVIDDPAAQLAAARQAVAGALDEFRGKPNKIGRARVYAERTIGIDDPGMVAVQVMLGALG